MKQKKPVILALTLLLLVSILPTAAVAAGVPYTYTVRIYAGAQGTFADGSSVLVYENLTSKDRVTFSPRQVVMADSSKYYVKGIREAGKDNSTVSASFPVTRDQDYVVAYGVLGSAVAYTVHYVSANGQELAPSETYYGNIGDRPVVAFLYIEGYLPQAYNLTRVLTENAEENVFSFVYTPIPVERTPTPIPPADDLIPAPDQAGDTTPAPSATTDESEPPEATPAPPDQPQIPQEPVELIDLDNPEVPLASGSEEQQDGSAGTGMGLQPWMYGVFAALLVLVFGILWILLGRRRKKKQS